MRQIVVYFDLRAQTTTNIDAGALVGYLFTHDITFVAHILIHIFSYCEDLAAVIHYIENSKPDLLVIQRIIIQYSFFENETLPITYGFDNAGVYIVHGEINKSEIFVNFMEN